MKSFFTGLLSLAYQRFSYTSYLFYDRKLLADLRGAASDEKIRFCLSREFIKRAQYFIQDNAIDKREKQDDTSDQSKILISIKAPIRPGEVIYGGIDHRTRVSKGVRDFFIL